MKQCKYSQLPIPIPAPASKISDLARFARECRSALIALRDRRVLSPNGTSSTWSHPWKCTANGDEFVTVAAGKIISQQWSQSGGTFTGYPSYGVPLSYAGGQIEITAASGYIYAVMPSSELLVGTDLIAVYPTSLNVEFHEDETTLGADEIGIPIAEVSLTASVAAVEAQILVSNPPVWHAFQASP